MSASSCKESNPSVSTLIGRDYVDNSDGLLKDQSHYADCRYFGGGTIESSPLTSQRKEGPMKEQITYEITDPDGKRKRSTKPGKRCLTGAALLKTNLSFRSKGPRLSDFSHRPRCVLNIFEKEYFDMSTATIDRSLLSSRFSPEEIDRRMTEMLRRDIQEYREFWLPLIQEERRREAESTGEEPLPKTPK